MLYMAVEGIGTFRLFGDRYTGNREPVELIIQIIPTIRALAYIRGIHIHFIVWVQRICGFVKNIAIKAPCAQIVQRRGVADIIVHAERIRTKGVMAAEYIQPVSEYMGLPVRHILIAG